MYEQCEVDCLLAGHKLRQLVSRLMAENLNDLRLQRRGSVILDTIAAIERYIG